MAKAKATAPAAPKRRADQQPEDAAPTQREKFVQAAREAGCDETGEALDEALRTIGRVKKR